MAIEVDDMTLDDALTGDEKIPASDGGNPVAITPDMLVDYVGESFFPTGESLARISEGNLQVKNITTGLWHTMYLEGASGAGTLKFQAGVE